MPMTTREITTPSSSSPSPSSSHPPPPQIITTSHPLAHHTTLSNTHQPYPSSSSDQPPQSSSSSESSSHHLSSSAHHHRSSRQISLKTRHLPAPSLSASTLLVQSKRQIELEDESVYGPPSPGPPQFNHHLITIKTSTSGSFSPITPAEQVNNHWKYNSSSSQLNDPSTDELFLSESYPPIHPHLHFPFFNEKLPSPIGMGRGHPIIFPSHPSPPYGSLDRIWKRIVRILSDRPYQLNELVDTLSYPADPPSLSSLNRLLASYHLGLPNVVRDHFLIHDGQDVFAQNSSRSSGSGPLGIVWGLWLMSCEEVEAEWGFWRRFDGGLMPGDAFTATDFLSSYHHPQQLSNPSSPNPHLSTNPSPHDHGMSSCPAGWVKEVYSHPGWLPLLSDRVGNYIGVDLNPPICPSYSSEQPDHAPIVGGGQGHARPEAGQVIAFGREIDEKVVLWRGEGRDGWANWLASFADDLEDGKFARLIGKPMKRPSSASTKLSSRRNSDGERGWNRSDDDDDDDDPEDGLGDLGYFNDGTSFGSGADDGDFCGWRLAPEYRGMSVIEALCVRSKQRWAEVGCYSSRRHGSSRFNSRPHSGTNSSNHSPSSHSQPTVLHQAGPSHSRAGHPKESDPPTPIAFVTPPSPRQTDLEVDDQVQASQLLSTSRQSSSDGKKPTTGLHPSPIGRSHKYQSKPKSDTPKRPRVPPPAPVSLDLPTMDSLMLEAAGFEAIRDAQKFHRSSSLSPSDRSTNEPPISSASSSPSSPSMGTKASPNSTDPTTTITPTIAPKLVSRLNTVTQRISEELLRRTTVSSNGPPLPGGGGGGGDIHNHKVGIGVDDKESIGMVMIPNHRQSDSPTSRDEINKAIDNLDLSPNRSRDHLPHHQTIKSSNTTTKGLGIMMASSNPKHHHHPSSPSTTRTPST